MVVGRRAIVPRFTNAQAIFSSRFLAARMQVWRFSCRNFVKNAVLKYAARECACVRVCSGISRYSPESYRGFERVFLRKFLPSLKKILYAMCENCRVKLLVRRSFCWWELLFPVIHLDVTNLRRCKFYFFEYYFVCLLLLHVLIVIIVRNTVIISKCSSFEYYLYFYILFYLFIFYILFKINK